MTNIEVMNQASDLYKKWTDSGSTGFWLDFYETQSGNEFGSEEYDLVYDMTAEGLLQ